MILHKPARTEFESSNEVQWQKELNYGVDRIT